MKTQELDITFNLNHEEKKLILELQKKAKKAKVKDSGDWSIDGAGIGYREFLDLFAKNRGVKIPDRNDTRTAIFGSVPMHTDCLSGKNYKTLIVFIHGHGLLSHFTSLKAVEEMRVRETYLYPGDCMVLDDALPHSYFNKEKTKSVAILADLPLKLLREAKENENTL